MHKIKEFKDCKDLFEYRRQFSTYHFDHLLTDTQDHGLFKSIATFTGNWSDELKLLTDDGSIGGWSKAREELEKFLNKYGTKLSNSFRVSQLDSELNPKLYTMAEAIGLKNFYARVHVQKPGQMMSYHLDKASAGQNGDGTFTQDRSKIARVFVFLDDWHPGHFVTIAQTTITWKKGEAVWVDWQNAPHCTANAGHVARPVMLVTGHITDEFQNLFYKSKKISI